MEWIQPTLLLGLFGISVPLAIHLWNGRRGKVIAWAATAWLSSVESQSSRSLKLDQLLLLLVRIALWAMIVFFLAGLWWNVASKGNSPKTVHLIMPNAQVEADFRFELEMALEKGEEVFWMTEDLPSYESGDVPPVGFKSENLPSYLELLPENVDSIHWYAMGTQSEIGQSMLWLPKAPKIHFASKLSRASESNQVIQLESGSYLGMDESGVIVTMNEASGIEKEKVAWSGAIPIHIDIADTIQSSQIRSALAALTEVYGLTFSEGEKKSAQAVFSDRLEEKSGDGKLYFQTEAKDKPFWKHQSALSDPVSMPWIEMVDREILPELILDPLINSLGISSREIFLTEGQLKQRFVEIPQANQSKVANTSEIFLILIVLLFGLERFLSYRNNQ
jgi:hypothetical protein